MNPGTSAGVATGVAPLWTGDAIAMATEGRLSQPFFVGGVQIDSRDVSAGDLFIALSGATMNGHDFVDQAVERGAAGVITDRPVSSPHVAVGDSFEALVRLADAARGRTGAKVIGVTGSVGKTGTKEVLAAALARTPGNRVHRSIKSFNNHTGVPLSLARMPADSDYAVLEMGMNHQGELAALTRMVRPHVAIVTAIAPAHIAHFADEHEIALAKGEIFLGLEPGGTALVPFDSPHRDTLIRLARPHAGTIWTFGLGEGADFRARDIVHGHNVGPDGRAATLVSAQFPGGEVNFTLAHAGDHWVSNALAVMGATLAVGADLAAAGLALAEAAPLAGRGARRSIPTPSGDATLIDESYNANAASVRATLKAFSAETGRRIAVLGEMRELGHQSDALHAGLAPDVEAAGLDQLILVGPAMDALRSALRSAGASSCAVTHVEDAKAAQTCLAPLMRGGDVILVKGSNGVGLAALVAAMGKGG